MKRLLLLLMFVLATPAIAQQGSATVIPESLEPVVGSNCGNYPGGYLTRETGRLIVCNLDTNKFVNRTPGGGDMMAAVYDALGDGHVDSLDFGTAFPSSPNDGDVYIVLDDSAAGACDSGAGSDVTLCRWDAGGSTWEAVGGGGGGHAIYDEDSEVTPGRSILNITGQGMACTDDGVDRIDCKTLGANVFDVTDPEFGATGDDYTDDEAAIQAADDAAAAVCGTVHFPFGHYVVASQIEKDSCTSWVADPGGLVGATETGVSIQAGYDGVLVNVTESASTYVKNKAFKGLHFVGDATNYPNATAIYLKLVRQIVMEDIQIQAFDKGIDINTVGELYMNRVFINGCNHAVNAVSLSDSWIRDSHFGSGNSRTGGGNAISSGGTGWYGQRNNSVKFIGCRFQVQDAGFGAEFYASQNLDFNACIFDQNDNDGLLLEGTNNVRLSDSIGYDNGLVGTPGGTAVIRTRTYTFTAVGGSGDLTVSAAGGDLGWGVQVQVYSDDTLPNGFDEDTRYWAHNAGGTVNLYATRADLVDEADVITPSDAGTGHTTFTLL